MNTTLKNEYLKDTFTLEKHQEEHASLVVPYRLDCVFAVSSLKRGNRFVGHPLMSQYPQTSPVKCLKAVEFTTFSDDVFDAPVQTLGNRIGSAYVPSIQYILNMPVDSVGRFWWSLQVLALIYAHIYPDRRVS